MATANPDYTASDIIEEVNSLLTGGTNLSAEIMLPWISTAYQRLYAKISSVSKQAKEELFGDRADVELVADTLEYTLTDSIPRFGGFIKVAVRYGASEDDWNPATRLLSIEYWKDLSKVSTQYQAKTLPLYYQRNGLIGVIPTAVSGETDQTPTARVWFVKRAERIDEVTDIIDIPYRFCYPIVNYVLKRTLQRVNEDYATADQIDRDFKEDLEEVALSVASEFEEGIDGIEVPAGSALYDNPFNW